MKLILFNCFVFCLFIAAVPHQILKTSLQVTVRNDLGNAESGVSVSLYKTKEDNEKHTNPASQTLKTDKFGKVLFKNLEPLIYFINAEYGDKNNVGAGEQSTALQANRINKLTVVITD